MSHESAAAARRHNDTYMTPEPLASAIVHRFEGINPWRVLEPSAGDGSFARAAQAHWPLVELIQFDVTPRPSSEDLYVADFLSMRLTDPSYAVDLVIGNPPYSLAEQFVCHSLTLVKPNGYVIFLLRLSFLCSSKRINGLYQKHPLRAFAPIAPRPSFTEGGNDNSEYAAFVWQQGFTGVGRIEPPIIWRKS